MKPLHTRSLTLCYCYRLCTLLVAIVSVFNYCTALKRKDRGVKTLWNLCLEKYDGGKSGGSIKEM